MRVVALNMFFYFLVGNMLWIYTKKS